MDDKNRFAQSRMAGAFLGLRPRKDQSGKGDPQLRITKAGDSDLERWGLELAKRGGKNAKKRAKVAVARKLAVLMHRLWVTGEVYEPLGYRQRRKEQEAA
jgi:transposase